MLTLHPNAAELYRVKVADLEAALNTPGTEPEAAEALRLLIDRVVLLPDADAQMVVTGASTARPSALTVRLAHSFWHPEPPDRGHDKWDVLVRRAEKLFSFGSLPRRPEHRTS